MKNESLTASDNLKFRFATDGEGNYGYLGADDSFVPFKKSGGKLVKIGSISLSDWAGSNSIIIDCTGLDGWESMTNDSFAVVLTSSSIHSWSTGDVKIDRYGGINAAKSYNASIGKLTVSCSGTQTHTYHGGGKHSYTTTNGSFDIYAVQ